MNRGFTPRMIGQLEERIYKVCCEIIDNAVQLHGARGVVRGECVERLYREIRALRIYEGATEVQRLVIGRELLRPSPAAA